PRIAPATAGDRRMEAFSGIGPTELSPKRGYRRSACTSRWALIRAREFGGLPPPSWRLLPPLSVLFSGVRAAKTSVRFVVLLEFAITKNFHPLNERLHQDPRSVSLSYRRLAQRLL